MSLLEFLLKEYLSIVAKLEATETVENNRIVIDRDYFRNLLEKYPYITFRDKTKVYKALNLIIHDKNNYTMPCKVKGTRKTVRKVVINYKTYLIIKSYYYKNM
ncbi:hypothetical protein [Thomasclavelia cocleata]|uniref:TcpK family conjugal transfer DNA-binding protein n=1 Tax=Thomasclavelia cocleata TaxID=69824 RepID=UPI00258D2AFA|nr:hypothetical protein [Thomasclavelia cocleata]